METAKAQMLRGELYDAEDPALAQERRHAKEICWQANQLPPSQADKRHALLRGLFGGTDGAFTILPDFWCDYG